MSYQIHLADAVRGMGVAVVEHDGWQERGSYVFTPAGGVAHHTGPGSPEGLVALCIRGRSDLPGPLAQVVLAPDGVAHVIAAGRANHAGAGGWGKLVGNSSVWGIEAVHPGSSSVGWPAIQVAAYQRTAAAMAQLSGFPADRWCAHREWAPKRKPDPVALDMDAFRAGVSRLLASVPKEVVMPEYDPPHVLQPIVASERDPMTGGLWLLAASGSIYAYEGARYFGGADGKNYFVGRRAARLEANDQGGYDIIAASGERYGYPE